MVVLFWLNISMPRASYALFNFGELGYPGWVPVSYIEMQIMWEGSQELIADAGPNQIEQLVEELKYKLLKQAIYGLVDEDWISHAVMITAIEGHQGKPLNCDKFRVV